MTAILEQERAAGYAEGYDDGRNWNGQYLECLEAEAFCKGQQAAWANTPSRLRWFAFGLICGAAITVWWLP